MATVDTLISVYSSHQIYLERVSAGLGNDAEPFISSVNERVNKLLNNLPKRRLTKAQEDELRAQINLIVKEELQAYTGELRKEHRAIGGYEAEFSATATNDVIETDGFESEVPAAAQVAQLANSTPIKVGEGNYTTYTKMMTDYWSNNASRFDSIVLNGFAGGQTNEEIARLIDSDMESWSMRSLREARAIARTGTNHYATSARIEFANENEKVIVGFRSVGTIDSRTSQICRSLDGVVMRSDNPKFSSFKTPRHINCRSALIHEIDGRYTYDGSSSERPTNFTVDGKKDPNRVNSKRTYYQEMKKLSAADQDNILGPTLGKAFRKLDDPELFAKETVNQATLQPLTIEEMKKKDNQLGAILRNNK